MKKITVQGSCVKSTREIDQHPICAFLHETIDTLRTKVVLSDDDAVGVYAAMADALGWGLNHGHLYDTPSNKMLGTLAVGALDYTSQHQPDQHQRLEQNAKHVVDLLGIEMEDDEVQS